MTLAQYIFHLIFLVIIILLINFKIENLVILLVSISELEKKLFKFVHLHILFKIQIYI